LLIATKPHEKDYEPQPSAFLWHGYSSAVSELKTSKEWFKKLFQQE